MFRAISYERENIKCDTFSFLDLGMCWEVGFGFTSIFVVSFPSTLSQIADTFVSCEQGYSITNIIVQRVLDLD